MKIYLATLLPCPRWLAGDEVREETRCRVNEWIRTTYLIDGVIDFERAVMDPNDPKRIAPEYDSGDQLHPSLAGAARMADSVPLEFVVG